MRNRVVAVLALIGCIAVFTGLFAYVDARPHPLRIALYGDSLSMQSAQDFEYMAAVGGTPVLLGAYNGWAICDVLPRLASDATTWKPTVAVIEFSGNSFTPCMKGYTLGTPAYYAKYRADAQAAIDILRRHGIRVLLMGVPLDAWPSISNNVERLNAMYAELAAANPGVEYHDAGQAVMADGRFTWQLPCLPFEPCTGPAGNNVVRSPDGVHFCPTGNTRVVGPYDLCDVYSSGAFRFASAMLRPALNVENPSAGR